ncbi:MAG: hypothetical protein ABSC71_18045, partial [Candidatus Acidiferrales bacterium]
MPSRKPKELKSKSRPAAPVETTKPPAPVAAPPATSKAAPNEKPKLAPATPKTHAPVPRYPNGPKRLFLIDAMGFIFRAFFAPMPMRMRSPGGLPTNVPF